VASATSWPVSSSRGVPPSGFPGRVCRCRGL